MPTTSAKVRLLRRSVHPDSHAGDREREGDLAAPRCVEPRGRGASVAHGSDSTTDGGTCERCGGSTAHWMADLCHACADEVGLLTDRFVSERAWERAWSLWSEGR